MSAVYNEIEPYAADWLVNLEREGHVAPGIVDRRSIADVIANDVAIADQFHAFAGIGCWSLALRLAGVADDDAVWTGSCPCQPFSAAGKRGGFDDARHLWPEWFRLIRECKPPILFGEQVASRAGLEWLDAVFADLEGAGYACAAADLCAAGEGAPHIRQRLYFVAHTEGVGRRRRRQREESRDAAVKPQGQRPADVVVDADGAGLEGRIAERERADERAAWPAGVVRGFWSDAEWLPCTDGKARAAEPGTQPLAHGAHSRMGRLRACGNAIVPQVAATFITSALSAIENGVSL
jgi:DNA (cytosine-5)-methyltransferase 1